MKPSPRVPTVPQMQTSSRSLESSRSSIYNLFAPHLIGPGSSLTFANETPLCAAPSSLPSCFPALPAVSCGTRRQTEALSPINV